MKGALALIAARFGNSVHAIELCVKYAREVDRSQLDNSDIDEREYVTCGHRFGCAGRKYLVFGIGLP